MEFTAIYNTEAMKGIEYSFKSDSVKEAKYFCHFKFSAKDIVIINHDDNDTTIHMGDKRKTNAIYRAYVKRNNAI